MSNHFIVLENEKEKILINLDLMTGAERVAMVNITSGQVIEGKFCTKVFTVDGRKKTFYDKAGDLLWELLRDMSLIMDDLGADAVTR